MAHMLSFLFALCIGSSVAIASKHQSQSTANPIRKVVSMLESMQKKVAAEGKVEDELFGKFMCYCKNGEESLSKSISDAEAKVPAVTSDISEAEAQVKQLSEDLKAHQSDRRAAKEAMAEATAIREKESAAFGVEKSELDANIAAVGAATTAIEKGMTGSFLQTTAAQVLKKVIVAQSNLDEYDREELTSFLSGSQEYAPQSGQIVGILKEMHDTMDTSLADATSEEKEAIKSFEGLLAAKSKEVNALTKSIEEKMVRLGETKVAIVEMKQDLDDTSLALLDDRKFLSDLDSNCALKTKEHEENIKLRSQELVALADTVKILNDDDALELFKKTLPSSSASFLQVNENNQRQQALAVIRANNRPELNFIALALQGKSVDFGVVIKMIDEMVGVLKTEQQDDDDKKEYCQKQFDTSDDKKKGLERSVSDLETAIEKEKEGISTLAQEIKALEEGIADLDKSVASATAQRQEENKDYTELMASDAAAKELLQFAKNRLNKFYNPALYKPPPKRVLSEEDRITVNMGGTLAPIAAPGGIAGTGVTVLADVSAHDARVAPPPPPETAAAFSKKSEESNGVIGMIDLLIGDLTKEMTEAETTEKDSQSDYETAMKDAAEKRATDTKTLADKGKAKAELQASMESNTEEKAATTKTLMATLEYIQSLHAECDWLLQYYEVRKEAREAEVDSLKNAKAVLSGADFSFVETKRSLRGHA